MAFEEENRVSYWLKQAAELDAEQFAQQCGPAVLVVLGGLTTGDEDRSDYFTRAVDSVSADEYKKKRTRFDLNARVFPVAKRDSANHYSKMIIVGRAPNSDICLESTVVSKMHAYFTWQESPEGKKYKLMDGGSSNGTWCNEKKIEAHKPFGIKSGMVLSLGGSVFLRFYFPNEFFLTLQWMNGQ